MNKLFILLFVVPTLVWAEPMQPGRFSATTEEDPSNSTGASSTNGAGIAKTDGNGTQVCPMCVNKGLRGKAPGFSPGTPSAVPSGAGPGAGVE